MLLVTASKSRQLLYLSFISRVQLADLSNVYAEIADALEELGPGFRLLTDFGRLESFDLDGIPVLGKVMEMCDQKGVSLVVRVIPEPAKDIGMNILSVFHYPSNPRTITCDTMLAACQALSL